MEREVWSFRPLFINQTGKCDHFYPSVHQACVVLRLSVSVYLYPSVRPSIHTCHPHNISSIIGRDGGMAPNYAP